jgi:hypothetical protein
MLGPPFLSRNTIGYEDTQVCTSPSGTALLQINGYKSEYYDNDTERTRYTERFLGQKWDHRHQNHAQTMEIVESVRYVAADGENQPAGNR